MATYYFLQLMSNVQNTNNIYKRGDPFRTRSGASQEPMGWGLDPMSAEMGVVCSSLWDGASRREWGSTLESLGNGMSAGMVYWLGPRSGTGRQQGSLERSLFRDEHGLLKLMDGGSHSLQVNLF